MTEHEPLLLLIDLKSINLLGALTYIQHYEGEARKKRENYMDFILVYIVTSTKICLRVLEK